MLGGKVTSIINSRVYLKDSKEADMPDTQKGNQNLGSMDDQKQRDTSSQSGQSGYTSESDSSAREAGKKGGESTSQSRQNTSDTKYSQSRSE